MSSVAMDTGAEVVEGCGEEPTGRKKWRLKQLRSRLFGRGKRKDTQGLMKQSQSASDVTADVTAGGVAEGYDSEDDCVAAKGTLGSRALSHDSIFLADQSQGSVEPARVLSQESVQGKIRALQLKLQRQNMRMGPPPLLIPGKRMEDSGATSEDDGLPHSPPDVSFHDRAGQGSSYKPTVLDPHRHHSSLSLAGTGSEEEEQWSSRPSSRPLSPSGGAHVGPAALSDPEAPLGVDLNGPAQYTPSLDSSAARHRLSVRPRNQRASAKARKPPPRGAGPCSESLSDLDPALAEGEEGPERETAEERGKESRATLATAPEKTLSSRSPKRDDHDHYAPVPPLQTRPSPEGKPCALTPSAGEDVLPQKEEPWALTPSAGEDVLPQKGKPSKEEEEGRFTNNPLFLQAMPRENNPPPEVGPTMAKTLIPDGPTSTPPVTAIEEPKRLPELIRTKSGPIVHTLPSNAKRELTAYGQGSSPPSQKAPFNRSVFGLDSASSSHKLPSQETVTPETTSSNRGLGKNTPSSPARATALPNPAPRVTRPAQTPASVAPPAGVEQTAPPAGQGETLPAESSRVKEEGFGFGSSHRFSVSSARLRPETGGSLPSGEGEEAKRERRRGREERENGRGSLVKNQTSQGCVGRQAVKTEVGRVNDNRPRRANEREEEVRPGLTREKEEEVRLGFTREREEEVHPVLTREREEQRSTDSRTGTEEGEKEDVRSERKGEGEEGRRGAFGVKLRPTSQSVKYRSETVQSQLRAKRHSVEIMATEPQPIKGEEGVSSKVGGNKVVGSEPAWMSVAREMTRSLQQHFTSPAASETTPNTDTRPGGKAQPQKTPVRPSQTPQPPAPPPAASSSSLPKAQLSSQQAAQLKSARKTSQGETKRSWKRSDKTSAETKTESGKGQAENLSVKPEISSSSSASSSSASVVSALQQSVPQGGQPSWMELAKRKSMAWNDKTMD